MNKNTFRTLIFSTLALATLTVWQHTKILKMNTAEQIVIQNTNLDTYNYNLGYRAGRMDMVAEIVECDGVNEPEVMSKYLLLGELMNELGELDHSVYPCEE